MSVVRHDLEKLQVHPIDFGDDVDGAHQILIQMTATEQGILVSNDVTHQRPNLALRGVIHTASLAQVGQTSAADVVDLNRRYSEYRGFNDLTRLKKNNTGCLNRCGCPF